jgi:hypothetical protein
MLRKLTCSVAIAIVLVAALPAQAGGWGVTTLENLTDWVVAGRSVTLRLRVRQHGVHLLTGLGRHDLPTLQFQRVGARGALLQSLKVVAEPDAEDDSVYIARVTFRQPGEWRWEMTSFPRQRMPSILVRDPALSTAVRERERRMPGNARATGGRLFVAKGCFVCHEHPAISDGGQFSDAYGAEGAPRLQPGALSDDYLQQWLTDPRSVRADARMPKLELNAREIHALIAFVNAR